MDLKNNHPLHGALFGLAAAAVAKAAGYETDRALISGVVVGGGAYAYMSKFGHSLPTSNHPAKLSSFAPSAAPKPTLSSSVSQAPLFSPSLEAKLAELRSRLPPPPSAPSVGTTFVQWYGSSKA